MSGTQKSRGTGTPEAFAHIPTHVGLVGYGSGIGVGVGAAAGGSPVQCTAALKNLFVPAHGSPPNASESASTWQLDLPRQRADTTCVELNALQLPSFKPCAQSPFATPKDANVTWSIVLPSGQPKNATSLSGVRAHCTAFRGHQCVACTHRQLKLAFTLCGRSGLVAPIQLGRSRLRSPAQSEAQYSRQLHRPLSL